MSTLRFCCELSVSFVYNPSKYELHEHNAASSLASIHVRLRIERTFIRVLCRSTRAEGQTKRAAASVQRGRWV
jgi:hypothetical protein